MPHERAKRVQEIIGRLLQHTNIERAELLKQECGDDVLLRAEVEKLLAALEEAKITGFLSDADPLIGKAIGPYRIQRCLGVGGMGAVYLAEQIQPIQRMIALKIIKLGMDTRQVIARFDAEREALSLMNHPNVAKVLDAGATDAGRPYFVMEYVEGTPITSYCDEHRLSTGERLKLVIEVCAAVQHAHQKGIIHRDIKPSNVLISEVDGKPVPKVIDFGIAKATQHRLTERTLLTEQGQLIGTPGYMSPEQAGGNPADIDTRTDVYSLGVLLYELLVGALPFDTGQLLRAGFGEMQRIIREVEPPKPSTRLSSMSELTDTPSLVASTVRADAGTTTPIENREISPKPDSARSKDRGSLAQIAHSRHTEAKTLIRQIRGDLDWIVMKCLEKARTRRYDTANGLALEISRFLNNEPVLAGPPSAIYRLKKFSRRNRSALVAVSSILIGTTGGMFWALWERGRAVEAEQMQRMEKEFAQSAKKDAEQSRDEAKQVSEFLVKLFQISHPSEAKGREITAREILDQGAQKIQTELKNQPELQARLMDTMGNVYLSLGLYDSAAPLLRSALEARQRVLGEQHTDVADSLNSVANLCRRKGDYIAAEPLYREALAMYRELLGDQHPNVAMSLHNLAILLINQGKYAAAEPLIREAIALSRKHLSDHPDVAKTLNNLAILLMKKGDYAAADPLLREALAMRRKFLGDDHRDVAASLGELASLLTYKGDYAAAEPLCREALEMRRRLLGDEHLSVAISLTNLGSLLVYRGDYVAAQPLLSKSLEIRRRTLGNNHPDIARTLFNLAVLIEQIERWSEAEGYSREAESIWAALDYEDLYRQFNLNLLGGILTGQGRFAEAEPLLLQSYDSLQGVARLSPAQWSGIVARFVRLYEGWDLAEPGKGYGEKAAELRAKLEQLNTPQEPQSSTP